VLPCEPGKTNFRETIENRKSEELGTNKAKVPVITIIILLLINLSAVIR